MFFIDSCRLFFFFFKQKTAYEMRISDWSSDVCSSDLRLTQRLDARIRVFGFQRIFGVGQAVVPAGKPRVFIDHRRQPFRRLRIAAFPQRAKGARRADYRKIIDLVRWEEHTSELHSLTRTSYAVFCWKKKTF